MSTCKQCALAADAFAQNLKNYGYDAALTAATSKGIHSDCEFVDCYCQHTIDKAEYVRDK